LNEHYVPTGDMVDFAGVGSIQTSDRGGQGSLEVIFFASGAMHNIPGMTG